MPTPCTRVTRRFQDVTESTFPYVDKSTGDKYYENFVVTPKGSIYRTLSAPRGSEKKRNTEKSHESHESACKRQRSAE